MTIEFPVIKIVQNKFLQYWLCHLSEIVFQIQNEYSMKSLCHLPEQPSTTKYFLSISYTGLKKKQEVKIDIFILKVEWHSR